MSNHPPATDNVPSDRASQPPKQSSRNDSRTASHPPAQPKKPRKARTKPGDKPVHAPRESTPTHIVDHARISNVREQPQSDASPRFGDHLPAYTVHGQSYVLHPGYAMNGHPYQSSPSPFHQPSASAGSPHNGQSSHMGPGIPGATTYPYPMQHPAYGHAYPSYPHYPAPPPSVVMYGTAPGPSAHAEHPHPSSQAQADPSTPPTPAPSTGKRKRKYTLPEYPRDAVRLTHSPPTDSSGDAPRGGSASAAAAAESKKRTKTQRACDSCRSRKIRCDVLTDTDPPECQHCKQYGFDCTFFLPITETRFRKQKLEALKQEEEEKEKSRVEVTAVQSPTTDGGRSSEVRVFGPTSPAYLLHSSAMISSRTYESYDMRYHHSWDVSTASDGVLQVHEPQPGEMQLAHPKPIDPSIERDVVEKLLNAYFTEIAPLLPVITREEFLANSPPQPVLLYAICLVAAARRDVPQATFDKFRYAVNSLIKQEDVLSTASIVNLQALLILAMCGDCHSQYAPHALSALWVRLGCAIRMAQDLGLHRAEAVKQNIELRRRLWVICVILDRWVGVTYGHPSMIDVNDCDARLPSSGDATDLYLDYLARLSLILGRVMKNIYTPAGLSVTTDEALQGILTDLEGWRAALPEELQFRGPQTPRNAGLLHMLYSCVNMLFWRVFMRISYTCPEHLKFALTVEKWTELVRLTGDAIDWLEQNERMYDVWLLVAYCATSCALVQYHTFARRQDEEAQNKLKKLRDCIRRWEAAISSDHMSARRKTAEIITLLYESTLHPLNPEAPALNPTSGVTVNPPLGGLVFRKDPTRPGGGVFVARTPQDIKHLPAGTIVHEDAQDGAHQQPHAQQQQQQQQPHSPTHHAQMVNYAPLVGANYPNVNPAMNNGFAGGAQGAGGPAAPAIPPGHVQVINLLDQAPGANALEQLALADTGFLEGMPATIFDWGSWDSFFARMNQAQHGAQPAAAHYQHEPYNSAPPTGPM
ncbi:GAL4 and fungal-specific transcription factor domain-containing protein [Phanerochaete sordida]|uniref:GAL4 and fungal-specific transcription factor domain-containing protein n=1 Tax=Phanerochaete sordida TaxID=48140 RepID=A0A9P3LCR3_9APHY|nr:GAL4 and fungal-specific transcription factor domain-containing protein [Phanerochaete sordida]